MAGIRKLKNKKFLVEVRKAGRYKSKVFDTKLQAQAWAVEIEQNLTPGAIVKGKTLGDALLRYQQEVSPSKKSWRNEHNRLNKFARCSMAKLILDEIQQAHFYDWIEEELTRIKSSSVNRDLNLFSSVFEACRRWRWGSGNPVRGIKRPRNPRHRDRRISDDEIERVLLALGYEGQVKTQRDEIAVAFLFAIETAMRQGEIWSLRWSEVYLDRKFLTVMDSKNGDKRDVPLSTKAVQLLMLLNPQADGKVFITNQKSSAAIFRRAVKLAEIENMTFHDARHEAISRLAQKIAVLDLARMIGHRDLRSLMIYYNPTAEEIAGRLD